MFNTTTAATSSNRRIARRIAQGSAAVLTVLALSQPASWAVTPNMSQGTQPGDTTQVSVAPTYTVPGLDGDDTYSIDAILSGQAVPEMHSFELLSAASNAQ